MHASVRKLLMLENRHLLRWGALCGYLNAGVGLLFLIATVTLFKRVDFQLQKAASERARLYQDEQAIITGMEDPERLRALALHVSRDHARLHDMEAGISRSFLKGGCIFLALTGFTFVFAGILLFRARELALEVEENLPEHLKQPPSPSADRISPTSSGPPVSPSA